MSQCDLFKWDLEQESKILLSCVLPHKLFHHKKRDLGVCRPRNWPAEVW